jgi:hypothetical protein
MLASFMLLMEQQLGTLTLHVTRSTPSTPTPQAPSRCIDDEVLMPSSDPPDANHDPWPSVHEFIDHLLETTRRPGLASVKDICDRKE